MDEVTVKSVPVVALLRLHRIEPLRTGRDAAGKHTFTYRRTGEVTELMNGFYADTLAIAARPFADAMYQVKRQFVS